ncbi:hypothetical protein [Maricaulis parjimensis]|uniref:hypothetical protein n=1 Tax=Maricaulis parjimensis TaxID=144023 RepID=UPI00193A1BE2|nr:hypothetical protein [Maricaulis parjimensis]
MAKIAVIDDDPVEYMLLTEFAALGTRKDDWQHIQTLDAFAAAHAETGFDLVFLDRRVPPVGRFAESLPLIQAAGYAGPVVLMSASYDGKPTAPDGILLLGPVEKSDIQSETALDAMVARALEQGLAH